MKQPKAGTGLLSVTVDTKNHGNSYQSYFFSEIRTITLTFVHIALQNVFGQLPLLICTFFIGHLPNAALLIAAVGLSLAFTEVTGTSISMGMTSAISTLAPQAIGANQNQLIAIYFQRAFVICGSILVIITLLQSYGGDILCALGQPADLCGIISYYCQILIIYVWSYCFVSILSRIAQSLGFNTDLFITTGLCSLLSIPLNVLLVNKLKYGYIGTAISICLCTCFSAVSITIILIYRGYGFIFKPLPFRVVFTVTGLKEYSGLSIPILFQVALPFWFYDLCLMLSGYVYDPSIALSAGTIIGSMLVSLCLIAEGLYLTLTMRIGEYIGAGNVYLAKRSVMCGFVVYSIYGVILSTLLMTFKKEIPYIYTNNDSTAQAVTDCMYLVTFRVIIYGVYINIVAVYMGLGQPHYPAIIMFVCMWCLTLTAMVGLLYGFDLKNTTHSGMLVIWGVPAVVGYTFGAMILGILLIFKIDWNEAVNQSKSRVANNVNNYGSIASTKIGNGECVSNERRDSVHSPHRL